MTDQVITWRVFGAVALPILLGAGWYLAERSEILSAMDRGDKRLDERINTLANKFTTDRQFDDGKIENVRRTATTRVAELEKDVAVLKKQMDILVGAFGEMESSNTELRVRTGVIENTLSLRMFKRPGQTAGDGTE